MGNYIVSARKYRPDTFQSVVGQSHVSNTLKSAILLDQLAHAFLFSGPRGVGKTTCARILAKAINCENLQSDGEPCNQCDSCRAYNEGKSINIHELDAASNNSVEDIRNLIDQTRYVPTSGKKSVYIIDEVHMLSQSAFNAFLKTLEEPPAHVLFILATTEKHKILPTILSRCQKFDFRRIRVDDIAKHLEYISQSEGIEYEYAALNQIALKADGALRDALSLYDQLVSSSTGKLTFQSVLENLNILDFEYYFRAVDLMMEENHTDLLLLLDEIISKGFEAKAFVVGLTEHFRNLLVAQQPETVKLLETSDQVRQQYLAQTQRLGPTFLLNAFNLCSDAEARTKTASQPRLQVELVLMKLAHLQSAIAVAQGEGEKKKPLSQPKAASKSVPKATTTEQSVAKTQETPNPTHPATVPNPPVQAPPTPMEVTVAQTTVKSHRKRRRGTGGNNMPFGANLDAVQDQITQQIQEEKAKQQAEEAEVVYEVNPKIQIDQAKFHEALMAYAQRLKDANQITQASILTDSKSEFVHNKWIFTVNNDLLLKMVEREQNLLPYLRQSLGVSELFVELKVDVAEDASRSAIPYTDDEKLKEMARQNPALDQLLKIFKTRLIYH
ncbi:DNA polymerase III subunit gamma/tau [Pontibacter sp. G13]|uniref:DNA polymerase III subunit gamma/tau n=1 Tax=Pontibacter sp. G13 TaxID=3074898 RepID=UPI00288B1D32|nr:DNA polymerase III subunit gamma/tau [Pontibacter sp. G13]WNJ21015.1 DNA polymerase III subunit gamma/tau [Pontibacter sp. G13]